MIGMDSAWRKSNPVALNTMRYLVGTAMDNHRQWKILSSQQREYAHDNSIPQSTLTLSISPAVLLMLSTARLPVMFDLEME
ncbi:MAG: hypothetical protein LZF61_03410 [Nitrosomonas sp.]|nr:MAG: hypothetical protein LZF61_03410 [Nitrosomonas sp.]